MSEPKWLATSNARAMARHLLRARPIEYGQMPRKWRLFLAACTYGLWERLPLPSRAAIAVAEAFADATVNGDLLDKAEYVAEGVVLTIDWRPDWQPKTTAFADYERRCREWELPSAAASPYLLGPPPAPGEWPIYRCAVLAHKLTCWSGSNLDEDIRDLPFAAGLIRDVFGNPYRPVVFDPHWRISDALGLARAIYEDRAFDRLPILADALMDAGCADEVILAHCRSDAPHVRGCWVVDLVLSKE